MTTPAEWPSRLGGSTQGFWGGGGGAGGVGGKGASFDRRWPDACVQEGPLWTAGGPRVFGRVSKWMYAVVRGLAGQGGCPRRRGEQAGGGPSYCHFVFSFFFDDRALPLPRSRCTRQSATHGDLAGVGGGLDRGSQRDPTVGCLVDTGRSPHWAGGPARALALLACRRNQRGPDHAGQSLPAIHASTYIRVLCTSVTIILVHVLFSFSSPKCPRKWAAELAKTLHRSRFRRARRAAPCNGNRPPARGPRRQGGSIPPLPQPPPERPTTI